MVIGAGAKILGPITLHEGAKVGCNAVVVKDVPSGATAVGVPARPARLIRYLAALGSDRPARSMLGHHGIKQEGNADALLDEAHDGADLVGGELDVRLKAMPRASAARRWPRAGKP